MKLFCGDCLPLMRGLPDKSVDMVLADLPYGTTQNKWDSIIPLPELWEQYRRVCKGAIVLTAAQPFTSTLIMSQQDLFRYDMVWVKNKASGHLNAKKRPLVSHESVLVFSEGQPPYYPQMSEGHKPANYAKRTCHSTNYGKQTEATYRGGNTVRYPRSDLHFDVVNNDSPDRAHPTQKPVDLMEYLIRTYTAEGQTVLDNCMGSGSTGVAALRASRQFIGIEKDETYFNAAKLRLELT